MRDDEVMESKEKILQNIYELLDKIEKNNILKIIYQFIKGIKGN